MRSLTIISHTEHYLLADGSLVGWGPTVTEINHLLSVFDTIYHVAMLYDVAAPASALPYVSDKVIFVRLPTLGGKSLSAKWQLIWKAPHVLQIIHASVKKSDWFQFRGPTGIGVYVIPFLSLAIKTPGWFKYAGNWNQDNPPLGYRIQRYMMRNQSRTVTINGFWDNQAKHCLTFENPCLTDMELIEGKTFILNKSIAGKLNFCFVGRLEKAKGVERIIQAMTNLSAMEKSRIKTVHLVGDGPDSSYFKTLAAASGIDFVFHGFLSRQAVFDIYRSSEVFLLPTTASEGFPKVIAEAMNYGCVPVVSQVSAIGHYIKHMETGICLDAVTALGLEQAIRDLLQMTPEDHQRILRNQRPIVEKFSFSHYQERIMLDVLDIKVPK